MKILKGQIAFYAVVILLICAGTWHLQLGRPGMGAGLIAGAIGVTIARCLKQRRLQADIDKGLNPYDERAYVLAEKSARAAMITGILTAALIIILGSIFYPTPMVNPYDFLGYCLAIMVGLYLGFYYYYNRTN
jgi:uncharacterized membrane protein